MSNNSIGRPFPHCCCLISFNFTWCVCLPRPSLPCSPPTLSCGHTRQRPTPSSGSSTACRTAHKQRSELLKRPGVLLVLSVVSLGPAAGKTVVCVCVSLNHTMVVTGQYSLLYVALLYLLLPGPSFPPLSPLPSIRPLVSSSGPVIFDNSFEHQLMNRGDRLWLGLIVDVWHPELSEERKQQLQPF